MVVHVLSVTCKDDFKLTLPYQVGDLGLSKVKCQTLISGGVRGTLPWMAPELLNGSSSLVSDKVFMLYPSLYIVYDKLFVSVSFSYGSRCAG